MTLFYSSNGMSITKAEQILVAAGYAELITGGNTDFSSNNPGNPFMVH
jgi:hypothetical protein